ncbi:unnamed protein product, partial [Brachionus calyciflorus]
ICEELMHRCLAPDCRMGNLGCDNMTVVIVCFLNGEPYEKLAEKCKSSLVSSPEVKMTDNSIDAIKISYETDTQEIEQ